MKRWRFVASAARGHWRSNSLRRSNSGVRIRKSERRAVSRSAIRARTSSIRLGYRVSMRLPVLVLVLGLAPRVAAACSISAALEHDIDDASEDTEAPGPISDPEFAVARGDMFLPAMCGNIGFLDVHFLPADAAHITPIAGSVWAARRQSDEAVLDTRSKMATSEPPRCRIRSTRSQALAWQGSARWPRAGPCLRPGTLASDRRV